MPNITQSKTRAEVSAALPTSSPLDNKSDSLFNVKLKIGIVRELLKQGLISKEESERIIELIKTRGN